MGEDFFKKKKFSDSQIKQISEQEYKVIQNFFSIQEVLNIDNNQIIRTAKILAPVFNSVKIVNIFDYINDKKESKESTGSLKSKSEVENSPTTLQSSSNNYQVNEESNFGSVFKDDDKNGDKDNSIEVNRRIYGKYLVQQVWVLEHLINNPNLLNKDDNVESVKRNLREKELELKIHSYSMQHFFDTINYLRNVQKVINFKHFESIKKDLASRILIIQKNAPINFKSMVDSFREFGFEDREELNVKLCSILGELIKDPKLQKLLKYTEQNFKQISIDVEKKKYLRKIFKN